MMNIDSIIALDQQYYMNTFGARAPLYFTHGKGCTLFDQDGNAYTDLFGGVATNALGYAHEGFTQALCAQAQKVIHYSNYYYNKPQALLAELLCQSTCADKIFFSSTGAEANEGAIKLARKYFDKRAKETGEKRRYKIISTINSFHGRTLGTLAATGQEKYRAPFEPMPRGFINVPYGKLDAMQAAVDNETAAVFVEPIQGEGGVIEGGRDYLQGLRALCDQTGTLLILDEVQTGMGRTGHLFAHQYYGVEPDIFTSAKALGNGLPISAVLCKDFCAAFEPGDHGTTLGGNALCTAAALHVVKTMTAPGFLDQVSETAAHLHSTLLELRATYPEIILEVRGAGLLVGLVLPESLPAVQLKSDLLSRGFIVGTAGQNTLRLTPPLIITRKDIDSFTGVLADLLGRR